MLRPEVRHIIRTERPTNFKLGIPSLKFVGLSCSVCVYTDGARRPASATSAITSKVKGQGHKFKWPVLQELADKSRKKVLETPKLVGRLSTQRAIVHTSFKVKSLKSGGTNSGGGKHENGEGCPLPIQLGVWGASWAPILVSEGGRKWF